jgi:hypothetical protein
VHNKILAKILIFKTADNMPAVKLKEKNMKKKYFFGILQVNEERRQIHGTGIDPRIRIRTKMSRIPNTGCTYVYIQKSSVVENLGVLQKAIGLFDPKDIFSHFFFLLMDFKTIGAYFSFIHWQQL